MMDGRKDDRPIDGTTDTPTDGRTDAWVRVVVAFFNCGDGCLGWSGISACFSFSAGKVTGCFSPGGSSTPFCFCLVTLGGGGLWAGRIGFVVGTCFTGSACFSVSSGFSTSVSFDVVAGGLEGFLSSCLGIVASGDGLAFMEGRFKGGGLSGFTSSSLGIIASGGGVAFCTGGEDLPGLSGSFSISAGAMTGGGEGVVIGFFASGGLSCVFFTLSEGLISVDGGGDGEGFCLMGGLPGEKPANTSALASVSPGGSSAASFCFCCATLGGGGLWAGCICFVVGTFTGFAVSSGFSTLSSSVSFDVVTLEGGGLEGFSSSCLGIASGDDLAFMEGCFKGRCLSGFTSSSLGNVASGGGVAFCIGGEDLPGLSGSFSISAGAMIGGGEGVVIGTDGFFASGGLSCVFFTLPEGLISVDGGGDGEALCLMGGLPGEKPANASALASVSPGGSSTPSFCFCCATLGGGGLWAGLIGFVVGVSCFTAST